MAIRFSILSLFPEQVKDALNHSITGRAMKEQLIELDLVQIRDFAINAYGQVDDRPYGGGRGMVMMCEPVYNAWRSVAGEDNQDVRTLFLTPHGQGFDQQMAQSLSKEEHIVLIAGHYEGVDRRVIDAIGCEEVSLGDFVMTGGELAVAVMIDAISRMVPGVLADEEAWQNESFSEGLLEWPQYTKPREWRGRKVPSVLFSGHAKNIEQERRLGQLIETLKKRPDLLKDHPVETELWEALAKRLSDCED